MRRRELTFKRGQRQKPPLPRDEVAIPRYPNQPAKPQKMSKWMVIAPSFTMLIMALGMAFLFNNYLYSIIMVTLGITYAGVNVLRQREQEKRYQEERERVQSAYANRIQEVQATLENRQGQQAAYLKTVYPEVDEIVAWAWEVSSRLWERSSKDEDFLDLRLGTGVVSCSYKIDLPKVEIPDIKPSKICRSRFPYSKNTL